MTHVLIVFMKLDAKFKLTQIEVGQPLLINVYMHTPSSKRVHGLMWYLVDICFNNTISISRLCHQTLI